MNVLKSFALAALVGFSINSNAQLKTPAPSPLATVKQAFALADITIEYSRPSMKGREIFGKLVPFDALWRTGANASTKITFGEDIMLEGNSVPAGTYALYTIPGKTEWTIVLNKNLANWGIDGYKQEEDLLRFKVKPSANPLKVETFTIEINSITPTSATIDLVWEQTRVSMAVKAEIDSKVMKNIETVMAPTDKRPFYNAASYYYENDKDLKQALEWATKGVEQNPKAYWIVLLKAKIQYKMKDFKGAEASADSVIALATEDKNDDYVKLGKEWKEKAAKQK
ncbi:MAG TPA: DUF2911 domain-containing protein [Flavobacteriales bacterium]|nr:DUF2911 domain-containing protein [Flavobacteriales bacterium]